MLAVRGHFMEMMTFHEKVKTFPQAISQGNTFNFPKKQATQMSGIRCKSDNCTKFLIKSSVSEPKDIKNARFSFLYVKAKTIWKENAKNMNPLVFVLFAISAKKFPYLRMWGCWGLERVFKSFSKNFLFVYSSRI